MNILITIINLFFILSVSSSPVNNITSKTKSILEDFKKKCPELSKSYISNSTFLVDCDELPIDNFTVFNENHYYCLGILDAERKLCDVLGNKTFENNSILPVDNDSLESVIAKYSAKGPKEVCKSFVNITDSSLTEISKYIKQINDNLKNTSLCTKMCEGLLPTEAKKSCSLLSYIYDFTEKIKITDKHKEANVNIVQETNNKNTNDNKLSSMVINSINPVQEPKSNSTQVQKKKTDVIVPKITITEAEKNISKKPEEKTTQNNLKTTKIEKPVSEKTQTEISSTIKTSTKTNNMDVKNDEVKLQKIEELKNSKENFDDKNIDSPVPNMDYNNKEDVASPSEDYGNENFNEDNEVPIISQKEVSEKLLTTPKKYPPQYEDVEDSNFFTYFMFISVLFIGGYVAYHNKQKILALVLEGRRDRNSRRRPNTASYRKLNSNLEEAVTSKSGGSATNVIF